MPRNSAFARCIALSLLALTVVSLTGCPWNSMVRSNAPTLACEQPPAQQLRPTPKGEECHGTDEQVRTCVQLQHALWDTEVVGAYATEVDKRATEDRCLQRHRDAGDIR